MDIIDPFHPRPATARSIERVTAWTGRGDHGDRTTDQQADIIELNQHTFGHGTDDLEPYSAPQQYSVEKDELDNLTFGDRSNEAEIDSALQSYINSASTSSSVDECAVEDDEDDCAVEDDEDEDESPDHFEPFTIVRLSTLPRVRTMSLISPMVRRAARFSSRQMADPGTYPPLIGRGTGPQTIGSDPPEDQGISHIMTASDMEANLFGQGPSRNLAMSWVRAQVQPRQNFSPLVAAGSGQAGTGWTETSVAYWITLRTTQDFDINQDILSWRW